MTDESLMDTGVISPALNRELEEEHRKSGLSITDKKAEIDLYFTHVSRGRWTWISYGISCGILPLVLTHEASYWGQIRVMDSNGGIIHTRDLPRHATEVVHYGSIFPPFGLLGFVGPADIQQAGILTSEWDDVTKKMNSFQQSFLIRMLLPEINKIKIEEFTQKNEPAPRQTVTPKNGEMVESETGKKLRELKCLLDAGLIREDEYEKKRNQILDKM